MKIFTKLDLSDLGACIEKGTEISFRNAGYSLFNFENVYYYSHSKCGKISKGRLRRVCVDVNREIVTGRDGLCGKLGLGVQYTIQYLVQFL
jgi:hypothetical protein